jgi:hypothetical protein
MNSGDVPIIRSIVAVGAGFFTVMVLGAAADMAFTGLSPNAFDEAGHAREDSSLFIKMAYESLFAFLAGYVTARIAIRRPYFHALVMGALVFAGRALIAMAAWDVTPPWFNLGILVLILPLALLGAKLGSTWNRGSHSSP